MLEAGVVCLLKFFDLVIARVLQMFAEMYNAN